MLFENTSLAKIFCFLNSFIKFLTVSSGPAIVQLFDPLKQTTSTALGHMFLTCSPPSPENDQKNIGDYQSYDLPSNFHF